MAQAPKFSDINHDDEKINRIQDQISKTTDPLVASPLNGAVLVERVSVVAGVNVIPHTLGRIPRGWCLVRTHWAPAISLPGRWHYVGQTGEPAFQNAWVNNDAFPSRALSFRMDGPRVTMRGVIKSGALGTVFTLPSGYAPASEEDFPATMFDLTNNVWSGAAGNINVQATGNVQISYKGGLANPAVFMSCSWVVDSHPGLILTDLGDSQTEDRTKVIRLASSSPGTVDLLFF